MMNKADQRGRSKIPADEGGKGRQRIGGGEGRHEEEGTAGERNGRRKERQEEGTAGERNGRRKEDRRKEWGEECKRKISCRRRKARVTPSFCLCCEMTAGSSFFFIGFYKVSLY
jgi:hypothetical protein